MLPLSCILLVDDDSTTNFLNQRLLQRMGVSREVVVAVNGQEALAVLQARCQGAATTCPALVLLDMNMPVMGGFELLEAYAQLPLAQRQSTVIVMLTTSLLDQDLARAQQLPVAGFLNKPLTRESVQAVLHQHFGYPLPAG